MPKGDDLHKKIRESVMLGSEMTRSPVLGSLMTRGLVWRYCSAISGEMLALNAPVPKPRVMTPRMKGPIALPLVSTGGMAEMMSKIWPKIEKAMAMKMVLKRPRYSSAMMAPIMGVVYAQKELNCPIPKEAR